MLGFLLTLLVKVKQCMKSSSALQRNEWRVLWRLFHKIDPSLPMFSSFGLLCKGIACRTISFTISGNAEHPPATCLPGIFQVRHSETSEKWPNVCRNDQMFVDMTTGRRYKLVGTQSPNCSLFAFNMEENGLFSRISSANKKKTKQRMGYFSLRNVLERL